MYLMLPTTFSLKSGPLVVQLLNGSIILQQIYSKLLSSLELLKRKGFLSDAHDSSFIAINKPKISEIKTILGRE